VDSLRVLQRHDEAVSGSESVTPFSDPTSSFRAEFVALFDVHFQRLYRYLDRLSGEPELAADLAQEAFVRLYRRGAVPEAPEAWLISVAMNLFRNVKGSRSRRRRLLTVSRGEGVHSDPPRLPDESSEGNDARRRVRSVLDGMTERERHLLLLRAEGYSYRDIAAALGLNEASVGVLLARAKRVFRESYEDAFDAP
jgi:RNA polymerase sigma-70 factor (ECF subfamily)